MSELHGAHGIIFAYSAAPELDGLVRERTASSLPFAGRYRLIDFSLSSMMNAGIHDVGIVMQRDYQSLLDHIRSGKSWDMSRKSGGLRILPPFGLPEYHKGNYTGTMEALLAVSTYVRSIKQENVVLLLGNLCANIDLTEALERHVGSGADITAICTERRIEDLHYRYTTDGEGFVTGQIFSGSGEGVGSLESYVVKRSVLMKLIENATARNQYRFHKDVMADFLREGGRVAVYVHPGYASFVRTTGSYYRTSMDMLEAKNRKELFLPERPVRTRNVEEVSTYYGENSASVNSLVADNCIIEGSIENCIVFPGVRIAKGAKLRNCIVMRDTAVGEWTELNYVIADKRVEFSPGITLIGSPNLPTVVPKGSVI